MEKLIIEGKEITKTEILSLIDDKLKKHIKSKDLEEKIVDKIKELLVNYHKVLFHKKNNWINSIE
jgi:hypothetical protein